jgi:hypothetical protein
MDTLVKWIVIIGLVFAVPVLRNAIAHLEERQERVWATQSAEREALRNAIAEINDKLGVRPDQVMDQFKAMRQEHLEIRGILAHEMMSAQRDRKTTVGSR